MKFFPVPLALAVSTAAVQIRAADFLLKDTLFYHGSDAASRPYARIPVSAAAPSNWVTPANYSTGTGYFRLEILEKPTAVIVRYQPCLEQDGQTSGRRACAQVMEFADPGIYTWSQPVAQWTQTNMDWTRRPQELRLGMMDGYGVAVDPAATNWVGTPYLALYYPMRLRFSQMMVSNGSAFPGWNLPPTPVFPAKPVRTAGGPAVSWNAARGAVAIRIPGSRFGLLDLRGRAIPDVPIRNP